MWMVIQIANLEDAGWWVVAALAGAVVFAVLFLRLRPRRRGETRQAPQGRLSLEQQRALERDISSLLDELSELSGRIGAQLDARESRMEELLARADAKLEELARASNPAPRDDMMTASAANGQPAAPDANPRHTEIYRLADEGRSCHEIAQLLDRPNGEVELILALRRG